MAAGERAELAAGDVVQVGGTRLRVRRAADALAAERRWVPEASGSVRTVLVLALLFSVWNAAELWLRDDPGGRFTDYLPVLIGAPIAVAIWAGFWSVGSKLIRHRFDFWSHTVIALVASLAMGAAALVLPVFAFASGWAWPSRIGPLVVAAIGWSAVGAHIGRLLPGRPRVLAAVMASLFVVGLGLYTFHNYETQDRVFPELYVATLAPPALRVAPTVSTARFVDEARALKAVLEAHIADDDAGRATTDAGRLTRAASDARRRSRRLEHAALQALDGEARRVGHRHHRHHAGLHGIGDDEVGGVGDAAGHVQADHEQALRPHLAHGVLDLAAHQRAGQHERAGARQAGHGAHGFGQRLLADQRDGVDRDVLAADVVAVGLGDRADRHLADLRAAAHDDDPLAVDPLERRRHLEAADDRQRPQLRRPARRCPRRSISR